MKSFTGRIYDPLNLTTNDIDIVDIAHHLSLECRFNGACPFHYSVAQHSVYVAAEKTECLRINAWRGICHAQHKLLHDASEAYLKDIPRPLKHSPDFAFYREVEARVQRLIFERFGLDPEMPGCVKWADDIVLLREGIELMNERYRFTKEWPSGVAIEQWTPERAKAEFLRKFRSLCLE